jgi:hypothetical protein
MVVSPGKVVSSAPCAQLAVGGADALSAADPPVGLLLVSAGCEPSLPAPET